MKKNSAIIMCILLFVIGIALVALYYIVDKAIRSLKVGGFDRKYIFITGCDSGFGHQLAIRLDGLGFPVFAACLTDEGQKCMAEKTSTRLTTLSLDVADSGSIHRAFDFIKSKLPQHAGLWAIVNNAGISGPIVPTAMCPMEDFYKTCVVNLLGPVEICRTFLPLVRRAKGRVVNMASVAGRNAIVASPYSTSKFGMEGFSDALRREVYHQGIKVSILEPGYFLTNIIDRKRMLNAIAKYFNQADEEVQKLYGEDYVEKTTLVVDNVLKNANPNTHLVVDAYTHAIVSRYPRTRYVIGWDARLMFVPLSWLPTGIADWILVTLRDKQNYKTGNNKNN